MGAGLSTILATGWASGVNLYATVLLLGIFGRLDLATTPEPLQSTPVLIVAGALYVGEFVADKIPLLDSVWDVVHTAIRPLGAAVVGALLAGDVDVPAALGAVTGGGMALGSHATKAGTRLAINASPEPASNIAVSLLEDGAVAGIVWFALEHPVAAGVLAVVLLAAGLGLLVLAWKVVRRGIARLRRRRDG
jgi:hypothetical protein